MSEPAPVSLKALIDRLQHMQQKAWQRGESLSIEALLDQFAELKKHPQAVVELISAEIQWRRQSGETAHVEEYCQRFPDYQNELRTQWLSGNPLQPAEDTPAVAQGDTAGTPAQDRSTVEDPAVVTQDAQDTPEPSPETHDASLATLSALDTPAIKASTKANEKDPTLTQSAVNVPGDTIDTTAWSSASAGGVPPLPPPSSSVHRFQILRPHARGGLGQVHVARDLEIDRQVALKEILPKYADSTISRTRFILEAEITGGLEHPCIVPVYSLGYHSDGRPYYAMRFIRGSSMKEAVRRFHKANKAGRDIGQQHLELRKLLRRFLDVCNAMEYAHNRGVIHRDLKPDNVMLGRYGETLVVDWGLAKPTGGPGEEQADELPLTPSSYSGSVAATQFGTAIGTPAYMGPEQASGALDQVGSLSDIYSLGSTLYYLLAGQPPFVDRKLDKLLERVRQGDFPPPRVVNPHVPRPLNAICLKAMALEPQQRYPTAGALAEDLEHWLADEPVAAYQESWFERSMRWMRRHRSWVLAGMATLFLVTIVSLIAAGLIRQSWKQEEAAHAATIVAQRQAERNKQEAVTRFSQARNAINGWLTGAGDALKYYPNTSQARERLLEMAARDFEQLAEQPSDDTALELERGRTFLLLGNVRLSLRDAGGSEKAFTTAEAIFERVLQQSSQHAEAALELARSRTNLGVVQMELGNIETSDTFYGRAIEALTTQAERPGGAARTRSALATVLLNRGELLSATPRSDEAERLLRQCIDLMNQQGATSDSDLPSLLPKARLLLGHLLTSRGQFTEADEEFQAAAKALDELVEQEPDNPESLKTRAAARIYRAGVLRALGHYRQEAQAYRAAATDYRALLEALPNVPEFLQSLAITQTDLGQLLYRQGATEAARHELLEGQQTLEKLMLQYGRYPDYVEQWATCLNVLGRVLADRGENDQARICLDAAITAFDELSGAIADRNAYRERAAVARSHLAQLRHKLGEHKAAEDLLNTSSAALRSLLEDHPEIRAYADELAEVNTQTGWLLRDTGRDDESREAFRLALRLRAQLSELDEPAPEHTFRWAQLLVHCGIAELRDPERAIAVAEALNEQAPGNARYLNTLGAANYRAGKATKADEALRQAIAARETDHAADWFLRAMVLKDLGDDAGARQSLERGRAWQQAHLPENAALQRLHQEAARAISATAPQ